MDIQTAGAPRDGVVHRVLPLRTLVTIEALICAALLIWRGAGLWWWLAVGAAVVVSALLLPLAAGRSIAGRGVRRSAFMMSRARRRGTDLAPAPFDIPGPDTTTIGARWDGDCLVTVVRILPPAVPRATYLVPQESLTDYLLPMSALAECLDQFDIALAAVDVVSQGLRIHGDSAPATTYGRTLGPLAATAHRSVSVVLRLRPADCPEAVARRGGGSTGALRTVSVATRRVATRLAEHGLSAHIMSAREITGATTQLLDGSSLDSVEENWDQIDAGGLSMQTFAVDPGQLPAVAQRVWTDAAVSTTLTVRLSRIDGTLAVSGLVRFDRNRQTADEPPTPAYLLPLPGAQFAALAAGLPIGTSAIGAIDDLPAVRGATADDVLDALRLAGTGCGQLIGADRTGRAVAVPVVGPGVETVVISGGLHLAQQVVLRAVAIGARTVVRTTRPERWRHLVTTVGDHRLLCLQHEWEGHENDVTLTVYDGVTVGPTPPMSTTLQVMAPGAEPPQAQLLLAQNDRTPQDVEIRTAAGTVHVTIVATPDEWVYTDPSTATRSAPESTPARHAAPMH
ncbi:type VII secretion protein EccE [Williamsia sterculiae]|uniref:Type VII secretion protein EccE n=1 Tax=Williamsia sterculiae TaxID=1344003 RepID=A0A1N7FQX7_9NOCA|nr:type VII secretion protein EccE [Williamsia sterculiae]SIS02655.1 type VII secretion protein EccE [Williamsia sterculiae]